MRGSSWTLCGNICSKILVFCATIIVVRILTKEEYGELGIIRSTIQMFIAFSSFGIGSTATKYIAQHRNQNPDIAAKIYCVGGLFVFVMGLVALFALIASSDYVATYMLGTPELSTDLRIGGIILFFSLLNGAQLGALAGFEDFKFIACSSLTNGVLEILLLPLGAYYMGLTGAILGFGICFLIVSCINTIKVNQNFRKLGMKLSLSVRQLKPSDFNVLYNFSLPMSLASLINLSAYWFLKTWLVKDAGFAQMANYDVAVQLQSQLLFIPGILSQVLLPIMVNNMSDGQSRAAHSAFKMNVCINLVITATAFVLILLFGRYILMIYGKSYTSVLPLYVLCFCTILDSAANAFVPLIISANKVWSVLFINILWATTLVLTYIQCVRFFIPEDALTYAYLCATIVNLILTLCFVRVKHLI